MPLSQDDRIAFSSKIVSADADIAGLEQAKVYLLKQTDKVQKLDTANKNLFDPVNTLVNQYQSELEKLDGVVRSTFLEQDIQDSANSRMRNYFFPNDTNVVVPSLSSVFNVWSKAKPFALTYAIGKNYQEVYPSSTTKEADLINSVLAIISSASSYMDIELTAGQNCVSTGSCSLPQYTTQLTCTSNLGVWTPGPDSIVTYPAVHTLRDSLVTAVNSLVSFVNTELTTIVTTDKNTANQTQNNAAISNINTVILPAINTWLAYSDFNTSHGQTTCVGFYSYDANLLAPTKLHSTQLTTLQTALNNRISYIATRVGQVNAILGSISQNLSTGNITSESGLYGIRYDYLTLRLDSLNGSLIELVGYQTSTSAQDDIKSSTLSNKAIYFSIVPTTALKNSGNGSSTINVQNASFLNPGDQVFLYAEGQTELLRAVKSVTGTLVVLNDIVPTKYKTINSLRLYKDLT